MQNLSGNIVKCVFRPHIVSNASQTKRPNRNTPKRPTLIVAILWSDVHTPKECHIEKEFTSFKAVFQIMQPGPDNVTHITFEADSTLHEVLLNPQVSDWKVRFKVTRLQAFIQKFEHIQYLMLHP